jgi:hypothetical protein
VYGWYRCPAVLETLSLMWAWTAKHAELVHAYVYVCRNAQTQVICMHALLGRIPTPSRDHVQRVLSSDVVITLFRPAASTPRQQKDLA